jgi:hypothetical protein
MYCPECRAEFREGFTACSDCHVPLVAALKPEPSDDTERDPGVPSPDVEMVTVFASGDPMVLALAKGSLEDANIPFFFDGGKTSRDLTDPWRPGWRQIVVPRDREAEARALLEPLGNPEAVSDPEEQSLS